MQRRLMLWFGLSVLGGAPSACGGNPSASESTTAPLVTCEAVDASPSCPTVAPSFANDVVPILNRDCNQTCHALAMGQWPLINYIDVDDWSSLIALDVDNCVMPPADAGVLTDSDRTTLLGWIACGSPNN